MTVLELSQRAYLSFLIVALGMLAYLSAKRIQGKAVPPWTRRSVVVVLALVVIVGAVLYFSGVVV
jgi:hypothetical protein